MPQNFVTIQSTNYKVLTQHMQLNVTVMEKYRIHMYGVHTI
jgi:hypothetical protein